MEAGLRWKMAYVALGLLIAAAPALAQTVPDASSNTPASDAVGPRELQNFSLPGTTTKPAEQQAAPSPAPGSGPNVPVRIEHRSQVPVSPAPSPTLRPIREATRQNSAIPPASAKASGAATLPKAEAPAPSPAIALAPPAVSSFTSAPLQAVPTPAAPEPERRLPTLAWLVAALVLAAGGIFLFWRRHQQRAALPGGSEYDFFVAPEAERAPLPPAASPRASAPPSRPAPQPAPVPAVVPAAVPPVRPSGIVASRLRPSLELAMQPLRCFVDEDQVTIEFEVELFNSGSAPARAVIAEASLFNASLTQEQELAAFYAKPPAAGDRIDSIPPMRRMTFTNRVVAPRSQVQEYELAGRKSFVPVLAFNAQYEWSGGKAQSSLAYLLGRETRTDKLGPLHLDGERRELRGLGARVLPTAVRT